MVKNEATGKEEYHKKVSVVPENIIYFQTYDLLKHSSASSPTSTDIAKPEAKVQKLVEVESKKPLTEVSNSVGQKSAGNSVENPSTEAQKVNENSENKPESQRNGTKRNQERKGNKTRSSVKKVDKDDSQTTNKTEVKEDACAQDRKENYVENSVQSNKVIMAA